MTPGNTSTSGDFELRGSPAGSSASCSIIDSKPRPHAGIQGASAVRMSHLYKKMLTVQVLFLGAHHFMSGGFADRSRNSGACHAVLSGGDPIRERLARHLLRPRLSPPLLRGKKGRWSCFTPADPALRGPRPCLLQPHGGSLLLRPRPGTTSRSRGAPSPAGGTRSGGSPARAGPSGPQARDTVPEVPRAQPPPPPPHPPGSRHFARNPIPAVRRGYSPGAAPPGAHLSRARRRGVGSDARAPSVSLVLLLALLRQWARPPSGAVEISLALRHILPSPPLPASPPPRPSARVPSPRPRSPPQGPPRGLCGGARVSGRLALPGADSAAQPPARTRARRGAVTGRCPSRRPRIILPGSARCPGAGEGAEPRPRVLTPPQERRLPPQDARTRPPKEAAPGGCVRPRADPVPRGEMPPAPARPPRPQLRGPRARRS